MKHETQIEDWSETTFFLHNKSWKCGIEGAKGANHDIQLGLVCEIINMGELDEGKEYSEYPFIISASIVPLSKFMHKEFLSKANDCNSRLTTDGDQYDAYVYAGGVPVRLTSIRNDMIANLEKQTGGHVNSDGIESYEFKDAVMARRFIREAVPEISTGIFALVGFMLDRPINAMGTHGWAVIRHQVQNKPMF